MSRPTPRPACLDRGGVDCYSDRTPQSSHKRRRSIGRPWNFSTGNLSVAFIQASPIGAFPKPNFWNRRRPRTRSSAKRTSASWRTRITSRGAPSSASPANGTGGSTTPWSKPARGRSEIRRLQLGPFPPVWLREHRKRTLMRCLEHGEETNYLSIFDPRHDRVVRPLLQEPPRALRRPGRRRLRLHPRPLRRRQLSAAGPRLDQHGPLPRRLLVRRRARDRGVSAAMERKYGDIAKLNRAWGTSLKSFDEVRPPKETSDAEFKPSPERFPDRPRQAPLARLHHVVSPGDHRLRRAVAENGAEVLPGGEGPHQAGRQRGRRQPDRLGHLLPRLREDGQGYGIVLQPADCQGAVFADKWMGTAYQFYGVKECTEPATALDATASSGGCSPTPPPAPPVLHLRVRAARRRHPQVHPPLHRQAGRNRSPSTARRRSIASGGDLWFTIQASNEMRSVRVRRAR